MGETTRPGSSHPPRAQGAAGGARSSWRAAAPRAAQEPGRIYRLGDLHLSPRDAPWNTALFNALKPDGFIDGQNLVVDDQGFGLNDGTILNQKSDILLIPDVVLGGGEAMRRREFIAFIGSIAAARPLAARAQQTEQMRRIGVLMQIGADDPETPALVGAFCQGLAESGWIICRDARIDYRWFQGNAECPRHDTTAPG
jgi:hypothetical protein